MCVCVCMCVYVCVCVCIKFLDSEWKLMWRIDNDVVILNSHKTIRVGSLVQPIQKPCYIFLARGPKHVYHLCIIIIYFNRLLNSSRTSKVDCTL